MTLEGKVAEGRGMSIREWVSRRATGEGLVKQTTLSCAGRGSGTPAPRVIGRVPPKSGSKSSAVQLNAPEQ